MSEKAAQLRALAARIGGYYCSCLEDYKRRGRTDPQCESCNTKDWRHEAAAELELFARMLDEPAGYRFPDGTLYAGGKDFINYYPEAEPLYRLPEQP